MPDLGFAVLGNLATSKFLLNRQICFEFLQELYANIDTDWIQLELGLRIKPSHGVGWVGVG